MNPKGVNFKWESKTFYTVVLIVGVVGFILFLLWGCSTTTTATRHVEETTTIQAITVPVPVVHGQIITPLVKPDSVLLTPFGIYNSTTTIETKDPLTKKVTKATIDLHQTLKKDSKGKPELITDATVHQEPIKTDGNVTNRKVTDDMNSKTEGWFIVVWNSIKYWILGLIVLLVGIFFLFKKFAPALLKTYLKIRAIQ